MPTTSKTAVTQASTADICDKFTTGLKIIRPGYLKSFGARNECSGQAYTVAVDDDNLSVKKLIEEDGAGRILVVGNSGSLNCTLLGDMMATKAVEHNWSGLIVDGCVRDMEELRKLPIAIWALATNPIRCKVEKEGKSNVSIDVAGTRINPTDFIYADSDGILIASERLKGI